MGKLDGKVAVITGGVRRMIGKGSHEGNPTQIAESN
jgi:hypothetical protein